MSRRSHSHVLSRRDILKLALATAAVPVLAACGATPPAAPPQPAQPALTKEGKEGSGQASAPAKPADAPKPTEAAKPAAQAPAPAPTQAPAQAKPAASGAPSSAQVAVEEAKKFKGETLTLTWQSGLQAQDPLLFSGPKFEELTGVKVKVVEITGGEEFSKLIAEHLAGGGAFDCGHVAPWWMPDMVSAGALVPLDDYMQKHLNKADLEDYLPIYKTIATWGGKYYGLFDDGDTLLWYYRKDLFEDAQHQAGFKSKYGRDLGNPQTYDFQQMLDAATYFTEVGGGKTFGLGLLNGGLNWNWFQPWLRMNGGTFFDAETMKPGINSPAAVKTIEQALAAKKQMPPGAEQFDAVTLFTAYLKGELAMSSFWPPLGRWAEAYGARPKQLSFVPETQIAGKTGYAMLPGGFTEMAAGFFLSVWANSKKKDLSYLFIQWLTSPEVSLERVMLPYALRDPYRISHVESQQFRSAWPNAPAYLDTIKAAGSRKAFLDLIMPGAAEYVQAFNEAATAIHGGKDVTAALDEAAEKWDRTTERLGRDKQQAAYKTYLQVPGATIESLKR
jgi:multiple sugar transport system substrate-binding protein